MAVAISNVSQNHRSVYFEVVGDGATTAITVPHAGMAHHPGMTAQAFGFTAPTSSDSSPSGKGGHSFPTAGTAVAISSVSVSGGNVVVNTTAAIGNGVKAYIAVVFDQYSD